MITYKQGDATLPQNEKSLIVHCCNDLGAWGAGFVVPLGNRFPSSKWKYKEWALRHTIIDSLERQVLFRLGEVQFVKVAENPHYVANLIGQTGIYKDGHKEPIRYDAIRQGLKTVAEIAEREGLAVQMPKMGAGLAGGKWEIIESIISEELANLPVLVVVL